MYGEGMGEDQLLIGGVESLDSGEVRFFVCETGNVSSGIERVSSVIQEENPEKFVWENGCLLRCELPIKLPIYYPLKNPTDVEKAYKQATEAVIAKLKDPQAMYMLETLSKTSSDQPPPSIVRGVQLDFHTDFSKTKHLVEGDAGYDASSLSCSYFSIYSKTAFSIEILSK